jgi:hypothetical protein
VTATNGGGQASASSAPTGIVTPAATPPSTTSVPTVSGVAQAGQTLTASSGVWSGSQPMSFAYQWQRCSPGCADIEGAIGTTFALSAADQGSTLLVNVTATNGFGSLGPVSSLPTDVVTSAPTTVTFAASAGLDDGDVTVSRAQSAGYPPSGTPVVNTTSSSAAAGRRLVKKIYSVSDLLLEFDTSSLPDDATITSVQLRFVVTGKGDANNRNLVGEWYDATLWPIDGADWILSVGTDALTGIDVTTLIVNATTTLTLTNPASVSLTGLSALRLGIDGGQPSGNNSVQVSTFENASKPKPQLIVTYTTP